MSDKVIWVPIKDPIVTVRENGWQQITEVSQAISFEPKMLEAAKPGFGLKAS